MVKMELLSLFVFVAGALLPMLSTAVASPIATPLPSTDEPAELHCRWHRSKECMADARCSESAIAMAQVYRIEGRLRALPGTEGAFVGHMLETYNKTTYNPESATTRRGICEICDSSFDQVLRWGIDTRAGLTRAMELLIDHVKTELPAPEDNTVAGLTTVKEYFRDCTCPIRFITKRMWTWIMLWICTGRVFKEDGWSYLVGVINWARCFPDR